MSCIPLNYDPAQVVPRIAHIGLGAFHRAHMAWACHELLEQSIKNSGSPDWGICALSLRGNTRVLEALEQQNHRYLLAIQGRQKSEVCEVGSIVRSLDAVRDGLEAVVAQLATADIVSLTITEKGYCINPATRRLDEEQPGVRHDLRLLKNHSSLSPSSARDAPLPRTVLGFLALGLAQRRSRQNRGQALLSCDNIPGNSQVLCRALLRFLELLEPDGFAGLRCWVAENCGFPCTMVDRITPAVSAETLGQIADLAGRHDPIALATEEFTQWVIQDSGRDFPSGRPAWERAGGVSMVAGEPEVALYEEMKLRMLNGSHSFLAYCGCLAGKTYIFDCVQDEVLRTASQRFILEEQSRALGLRQRPDLGIDFAALTSYAEQLIERYSNPHIFHRCYQIAMDGSLKVPQRWLDGYRAASGTGPSGGWHFLSFALAAWLQYLSGRDLEGRPIEVQDPHAQALRQLIEAAEPGGEAAALFSFAPTFGELRNDSELIQKVQHKHRKIRTEGLLPALKDLVECPSRLRTL